MGGGPLLPRATDERYDLAMGALADLRHTWEPKAFADFLSRNEGRLYPVLSRWGIQKSFATTKGWIDAFDAATRRWNPGYKYVHPDDVLVWDEVGGRGYANTRGSIRSLRRQAEVDRALRTLDNVRSGLGGTAGYFLYGDEGSDVGAGLGNIGSALAAGGRQKDMYKDLSRAPVEKPVAAEIAPKAGDRSTADRGTANKTSAPPKPTPPPPAPKSTAPTVFKPPSLPPAATSGTSSSAPAKPGSTPAKAAPANAPAAKSAPASGPLPVPAAPAATAPTAEAKFVARADAYLKSHGGRLADPDGALPELFRRTGSDNSKLSRAGTPELAAIDRVLNGPGGANVAQITVIKSSSAGPTPDYAVRNVNGTRYPLEVSTVTSAPTRGPELKATGAARSAATAARPPTQGTIEARLDAKGVQKPGGKPIQLSIVTPAAGRAGGVLMIFVQQPGPGMEQMVRAAMTAKAPALSPFVERVTFAFWGPAPGGAGMARVWLDYDRQPDGSYKPAW